MSGISAAAAVAVARACRNVAFQHQGRHPSTGLDCIGLVLWAYRGAGWVPLNEAAAQSDYQRVALDDTLTRILAGEAWQVDMPRPGDIMVFQWAGRHLPQHVAMVTEAGPDLAATMIIHCCALEAYGRRVVEHVMGTEWIDRMIGTYRLNGVGA